MSRLRYVTETRTYIVGDEIDEWIARQDALDRDEHRGGDDHDLRDRVRWRAAYQLLGGKLPVDETSHASSRVIPMEVLT